MKPIDTLDFWKQRIDENVGTNHEHYSVYVAHKAMWDKIEEYHERIIKEVVTGKVLDAGCGYGRLAPLFPEYTGVDFSPDFIAMAKERHPGKTFIQADLKALPFADHEFDFAICSSIKTMVEVNLGEEEWQKMLTELKRVAKQILILEYEAFNEYELL